MTPLLELETIAWRQGAREVLRSVTFSVQAGELLAIGAGADAGKSTLAQIIIGAREPSAGTVRFDGEPPRSQLGQPGGLQLARITFLPALGRTSLEQVAAPRSGVVSARRARDEAGEALRLTNATRLADQRPVDLHHDDRVRVGIAQAVMTRPRLLVLDEPLRGAEPSNRDELLMLLRLLRDRHAMTIVMTTSSIKGLGGWRIEDLADGVLEARAAAARAGGEVVHLPRRGTGS
ncbi:ATP-binding cassette domain-containing protein [Conexibacter sp. JD483]|uniref:ATP-binding cassette domain-containing protein n=1 Tax=unclassified Conexibacter TaxID=2627773 RepID=UPI0027166F96|nr:MULTISPECIES: ATP-binding cassette domain-containing protein [unclassified Conexibacter]MDO8185791.1 ATP-binding cassette domain-containing protein [Conexibacter sp. CPCC 205706]MDO8198535.1 ATP-binding cassette domain-containing protein [Conexibacter sp. CPCC 205762]MDR9367621.1 ATP-binding cassette domain-containing protein [Conexibacter sp. JD483]